MAEHEVSVEFVFDRAGERALAHAYRVLVPERQARTAHRRDKDVQSGTSDLGEPKEPCAETGAGYEPSALGA
jgi:hypothetical protein